MRDQLFKEEYETLDKIGSVFSRYSNKLLDGEPLESYQLATLMMLIQRFGLLTVYEFVRFKYDLKSNHIVVAEISPSVLKLMNLEQVDDNTFEFTDACESVREKISGAFSTLTWPKHLRSVLHFCFEDTRLLSILNFVCGCRYWDAYNMYHVIVGRKPVPLTENILTNTDINPFCYLPDVPSPIDEAEDYLELFHKVCKYLPDMPGTGTLLEIEVPTLAGMITEEMWELSDKIRESSGTSCYRLADKLRLGYLNLMDLSLGIKFIRNSFYDFGVLV